MAIYPKAEVNANFWRKMFKKKVIRISDDLFTQYSVPLLFLVCYFRQIEIQDYQKDENCYESNILFFLYEIPTVS